MKTGISVADVCQQSPAAALVVAHNKPLREVIDVLSTTPHVTNIFVTDEVGQLYGIVRFDDLQDWVRLQCNLLPRNGRLSAHKTRRLLAAETVVDLVQHDGSLMAIPHDKSITEAMALLSAYGRNHIAVVDGNGRFLNTLSLQDVLAYMINKRKQIQA